MALADTIAAAISAKRAGWWRTSTAICHGDDSADGLAFRSSDDDPDKLIICCFSRGCHERVGSRYSAETTYAKRQGLLSGNRRRLATEAPQATQKWADQGYYVRIKQLAADHDPASAPLQDSKHE